MGQRGDSITYGDAAAQQCGDIFIILVQAGHESKFAHRPFRLHHAGGDLIDLAGDEIGFLAIDGKFTEGVNGVL